jgi:hypothetical protein
MRRPAASRHVAHSALQEPAADLRAASESGSQELPEASPRQDSLPAASPRRGVSVPILLTRLLSPALGLDTCTCKEWPGLQACERLVAKLLWC